MSETVDQRESKLEELTVDLRDRCAIELRHLFIAAGFAACFVYFNYIPLYHSDIWGHVSYGNWMLDHHELPAEDPYVPLAEGVPVVATAWLSQVILALIERGAGAEGLSHVFALSVLFTYLLYARVFFLQTGRAGSACGGVILVWLISFTRHAVIRPEMFGALCFAILLWLIVRADPRHSERVTGARSDDRVPWSLWLGIPALFVVWANLHGSFVVGFAVLVSFLLGRSFQVVVQSRRLKAVAEDHQVRRWLLLTELAVAASLINPYGMDLVIHTMLFSSNPNLNDVLEWMRLGMASIQGIQVGLSCLLLSVLLRYSRARVSPASVVMLMIFLTAVCLRIRMLTWYAPIVVFAIMPHLANVLDRNAGRRSSAAFAVMGARLPRRSYQYTLIAALIVWVCFSFSPASRVVLGGKPRSQDHLYNSDTPRGISEYLRQNPPEGQIVNPQWWGDWLVWDGPPDLPVFMTTNSVHVVPNQVWQDYMRFSTGQPGVEPRLERYRATTVVVHEARQEALAVQLRRSTDWRIVYQDDLGFVAVRRSMTSAETDKQLPSTPEEVPAIETGATAAKDVPVTDRVVASGPPVAAAETLGPTVALHSSGTPRIEAQ